MSHQDQITRPPKCASVLELSDHCENFLVEFSPIHIGIQGHPEFSALFAQMIYNDRREQLGELAESALASLETSTDSSRVADWILTVFETL